MMSEMTESPQIQSYDELEMHSPQSQNPSDRIIGFEGIATMIEMEPAPKIQNDLGMVTSGGDDELESASSEGFNLVMTQPDVHDDVVHIPPICKMATGDLINDLQTNGLLGSDQLQLRKRGSTEAMFANAENDVDVDTITADKVTDIGSFDKTIDLIEQMNKGNLLN